MEVLSSCLERIERFEPKVNAFVVLDREGALRAAQASEFRWRRGEQLGPADGVPATIKDNIAWRGLPNRQGSLLTTDAPAAFDAPAVARLKEAGCVLLGKTTMPEFGWKGVGDSPLTGITRNPWDLSRTSGGSSAGAAVAALLGMGILHLGTDGAGSIRIPASFCGVVGFKPSYGAVPSYPLSAMGGLAHLGPLARTVSEAALMLSIIGRPDHRDPTAWNEILRLTTKAWIRERRACASVTPLIWAMRIISIPKSFPP
ncbi:amidase family protein [Rhizobium yanglingense]